MVGNFLGPERMFQLQANIPPVSTGFTGAGELVVMAHALVAARETVAHAMLQLLKRDNNDDMMINAWLFMVFCSLKNLLDHIASFCQRHHPLQETAEFVYFATYKFVQSEVAFIDKIQSSICQLRWNGLGFHEAANYRKHEFPFVGRGMEDKHGEGIYDIRDNVGKGFTRDLVVPCFNSMIQVLHRLARLHNLTMPSMQRL